MQNYPSSTETVEQVSCEVGTCVHDHGRRPPQLFPLLQEPSTANKTHGGRRHRIFFCEYLKLAACKLGPNNLFTVVGCVWSLMNESETRKVLVCGEVISDVNIVCTGCLTQD